MSATKPSKSAPAKPSKAAPAFPDAELRKLLAPPEKEQPAAKLRRLLNEANAKRSYIHSAGAYDAYTAAIMTRLGFKALYGSGWQLAATKSMYPDIGVYPSHQMVDLVSSSGAASRAPGTPTGTTPTARKRWACRRCSWTWRPASAAPPRPSPWPAS